MNKQNPMDTAPRDGSTVQVHLADGRTYDANYAKTKEENGMNGWYARGQGGYFKVEDPVSWAPKEA